jgi:hypothetical protein
MIRLQLNPLATLQDAQAMLQTAIGVEFGTLPPYLYALYSIRPGTNPPAEHLIRSVVLQEMIHMCLASNMLNALGGNPALHPQTYPGPLPGDIGPDGTPLTLHLYPFSPPAMEQAMAIEQPEDPPDFPIHTLVAATITRAVTIGQFYQALDTFLSSLPTSDWHAGRNQIADSQFFAGRLFAIDSYADAHKAIQEIVSEGEGTTQGTQADPLDFQDEVAHYYRFGEIYHDLVLTKAANPLGYAWGPAKLGVDWSGVYPAIPDPGLHHFSKEPPEAQAAQNACNNAFSAMVDALKRAVTGQQGALGDAVRAMFALRMAALHAFTVPLADPSRVAGPAFLYQPGQTGETL